MRENVNKAVGVDAYIDPKGTIEFAEGFCKNGFICRDDVGIVPYAESGRFQKFRRGGQASAPYKMVT